MKKPKLGKSALKEEPLAELFAKAEADVEAKVISVYLVPRPPHTLPKGIPSEGTR
jgi:hypothetical protein